MKKEIIQEIIQYKDEVDSCIHKRYHLMAQKYGLRLEQYHLLRELDELELNVADEKDKPTVGDIAKKFKNSQNTISERLTRLENKGLVKRVKDEFDKRISRVMLTEKGRELLSLISEAANSSFLYDAVETLDEDELSIMLKSLKKIFNYMKNI